MCARVQTIGSRYAGEFASLAKNASHAELTELDEILADTHRGINTDFFKLKFRNTGRAMNFLGVFHLLSTGRIDKRSTCDVTPIDPWGHVRNYAMLDVAS